MMPLPTIDAHAHVFHHGLALAAGRRYAPDYDAPLALYLEQLDRHGLSHGVLVQPSFLGTDNRYLVACLGEAGGRLRAVAVVDPAIRRDALLDLDRAGVVGLRLNLIGRPLPDLGDPAWTALLRTVAGLGWHVELQRNASDLAILAPQLLERGVTVVLDHYGLPDPAAGAADPGFGALLRLGGSGRVWVKVSAPYRTGSGREGLAAELFPRLRDAFGLDRLMWGSDWPHTRFEGTQSYGESRLLLDRLTGEAAVSAAVLASPRELFRLDPASPAA